MGVLQIIGGILLIISCILLVVLVMFQDSKQDGMQALSGSQSDSYLSRNRGKTLDAKLVFITKILLIVFFVLTITVNIFVKYIAA